MRWTTKARALRVLSALPGGHQLYFGFQRHVTRTLRIGPRDAEIARRRALVHLSAWERFGDRPLRDVRAFEFGAGWHLGAALAMADGGVGEQVVTDIDHLARPVLVAEMARALGEVDDVCIPTPDPD